jgi:signal transduction histidine kinase
MQIEVAPGVGEMEADLRRVRQILLNLLTNALKFTPAGGQVTVTARTADGIVELAVRDTGIGIPLEDQPRIFDAFQQSHMTTAKSSEGTGLGLFLVKRLVELHGGRVWVESAPGQGSTFTFTLPLRRPKPAEGGFGPGDVPSASDQSYLSSVG